MDKLTKERMFSLGRWLEEFLNPKIDQISFDRLARNAISLLNINYSFQENDITELLIDTVTSSDDWKKVCKYYEKRSWCNGWEIFWEDFSQWADCDSMISIIYERLQKDKQIFWTDDYATEWLIDAFEHIGFLLSYKYQDIPELLEKNSTMRKKSYTYKIIEIGDDYQDIDFIKLREEYVNLAPSVTFTNGKMIKQNVFAKYEIIKYRDYFSVFPWLTVLGHIFFEFIEIGGLEYYIICERCNRFSIAKKRGKKYCSNKCKDRENYQRRLGFFN